MALTSIVGPELATKAGQHSTAMDCTQLTVHSVMMIASSALLREPHEQNRVRMTTLSIRAMHRIE